MIYFRHVLFLLLILIVLISLFKIIKQEMNAIYLKDWEWE